MIEAVELSVLFLGTISYYTYILTYLIDRLCVLVIVVCDRAAIEEVTPAESLLIKQSSVLSAEDRDLLACYHHGFDDEKVDIDLIICLLYAIHSQPREGWSLWSAVFHFFSCNTSKQVYE